MRDSSQAAHNRPDPHGADEFGQVLPFRKPGRPTPEGLAFPVRDASLGADDDLARYEQEQEEPIDYRHRMLMNVIALAITSLLLVASVWLADTIAETEKDQDCVLQGRGNCAPIELPLPNSQ
jgi:hypothetical protein